MDINIGHTYIERCVICLVLADFGDFFYIM